MRKLKIKKIKAFTLVELIIVITILAILATIAFVSFQNYTKSARDTNRIANITNISKGLDLFQVQTGNFPIVDNQIGTGTLSGNPVIYIGYVGEKVSKIIRLNEVPVDPATNTNYIYGVDVSKTKYQIATIAEDLQVMKKRFINSTYADGGITARVLGNYEGLLKYEGKIYNIPSLIVTFSGTAQQDLLANNTNYVIDKGENLPYLGGQAKVANSLSPTQVLQKLTNTGANLTVTGVSLPIDASTWNALSGTLQTNLGYPLDIIGQTIFGSEYFVNIGQENNQLPTDTLYSVGSCPVVNNLRSNTTPTRTEILSNINNYIGCTIPGGRIAGYTYSGSIINDNKMVLVVADSDDGSVYWSSTSVDIAELTNITINTDVATFPTYKEVWDGLDNTKKIVAQLGTSTDYAARRCLNKGSQRYLPAAEELNQLYCYNNNDATNDTYYGPGNNYANCVNKGYLALNKSTLPGFAAYGWYYSSTEVNDAVARNQLSADGSRSKISSKSNNNPIRCVTRF